ncbi:MAG TPA: S41 family peptidase [Solirubrobacteraceae bacterium]|nr:S41 family peptidase [Solirubrobacteraceae bacterium]
MAVTPVRKRRPVRWVLIVLVPILVLLGGIWLGGRPEDLPSFMRSFAGSSQQKVVIEEAMKRIARDYYRPISESQLSNSSVSGMVAGLHDRFSHYLTPSELKEFDEPPHFAGIGVEVGPMERGLEIARVFDESPADRAGLKSGDVIVAVNGRPLKGLSRDQAVALIKGSPGTDVVLQIEGPRGGHAGKPPLHTVRITRAIVSEPVVASATDTFKGRKLGVVALASFTPGSHAEVARAVQQVLKEGAKGIVFDLRDNGGGLVEEAQLIASNFIPHGVIVTTSGRTQPRTVLTATGGAISSKIPMVVLVDQNTASAAEIVTAALQDHHRATVVGSHTFGKGVFQEEQKLANGGALDITVGEYFTPNGRNLGGGGVRQGAGVQPEVKVAKGLDGAEGLKVALETLAAKVG